MAEGNRPSTLNQPRRFLGLELAGAKNPKSALAALEYYPKEQKIFLLDIFDRISAHDEQTGDEALLEVIDELKSGGNSTRATLGVNVPLVLPPCITCTRRVCPMPEKCTVPAVKWMREFTRKAEKNPDLGLRVREFTPYTQRPVELWVRYQLLEDLREGANLEIDETLGGNKAPLTARMGFLQRHLKGISLLEVWPKLTIAALARGIGVSKRSLSNYRRLEEGAHARTEILEAMAEQFGIFIYERDMRKLSQSLAAFDALICAYTALLAESGKTARPPTGFPVASGWVEYPKSRSKPTP